MAARDNCAAPVPDRTDWPRVAFGLGLAVFAAFQLFKLPPALPELLRLYDYDLRLAAGFVSVYAVVGLIVSLPLGSLIARFGSGAMVTAGLLLMALGAFLTLFWPQAGWLVLFARALEGLGFAICAIAGPVIANLYAGGRHLPLVIGLTAAWIPLGQIAAALMAAGLDRLVAAGSLPSIWQPLWGFAVLSALVFAGAAMRLSPGLATESKERLAGADADGPGLPGPPALERSQRDSLILVAAVFMLWAAQYFAFMTWLPTYLVENRGLPEHLAMAAYLLPLLVLVTANVMTGGLLRAGIAPSVTLLAGLALQAASWWVMPLGAEAPGRLAGIGLLLFYGLGAGMTPTSLFAMPSTIVGSARAGVLAKGFSIMMTGRNLGIVIGPLLLAQIFAGSGQWDSGKPLFGLMALMNLLLALVLGLRLRRRA